MGINAGEASFFLLHQYARAKKYKGLSFARSFGLITLFFVTLMLIPDKGWSQQRGPSALSQQAGGGHRLYARARENPAATALYTRTKENSAAPTIEPTSPLGQALASCDKDAAVRRHSRFPD